MNHHLRFAVGTVGAIGLALVSCSTPASKPEIALKADEVRYRVHFFEAPEGNEHKTSFEGVLSAEKGSKMLRSLQRKKAYREKWTHSIVTRKGQNGKIEVIRDFVYPTEYDPPKLKQLNMNASGGIFPVTPATPTKFETMPLGFTGNFLTKKTQTDAVSVALKLEQRTLVGFVDYGTPITAPAKDFWGRSVDIVITENKMEKPVFSIQKFDADLDAQDGQFIVIRGSHKEQKFEKLPYRKQEEKIGSENFVILIEVESGR